MSLSTGEDRLDDSLGVKLLGDIHAIFKRDQAPDRLFSYDLVAALVAIEEAPWGDPEGRPIDERGLARRLRPYGIKPLQIRQGEKTLKGYLRSDFVEGWERYVPNPPIAETSETSETAETKHGH